MAKNEGKRFEEDFRSSAPDWLDFTRLIDAGGWSGGETAANIRFTPSNICDFVVYSERTHRLYKMELKSVAGKSLPFGNIKKKKIDTLCEKITKLIRPTVVINYRQVNQTYIINAHRVQYFMDHAERKSIPIDWARLSGIIVTQTLKRVRYKYDLEWL